MTPKISQWMESHHQEILDTYHTLHGLAERSWKETETTKFLCKQLDKIGLHYETFDDMTGVVAIWDDGKEGPTLGIRADMDALWQLIDGQWKANHSCGHDAHMTMVLYSLVCLKEIGYQPKGRIKLIFQPAEETGMGAKGMIEKGVIDDIQYLLGIHLRPIQELPFGKAAPAIYHGAGIMMRGTINGIQAHAARPHLGINVVDSLAAVVTAINAIKVDPTVPMSAKVTQMKAGGDQLNIIPDYGEFGLDLRAQTNQAMEDLEEKVTQAVQFAGKTNGASVELRTLAEVKAAVPNKWMEQKVAQAIVNVLGPDALDLPPVTSGGEDFHFYMAARPQLAATMVALGSGLHPGLHHPNMKFDLDSLAKGAAILASSTIHILEE